MAISFGGYESWGGNRTVKKPAPKPEPAPPKPPAPTDNNDRYGIKPFTPTYEGWMGGLFQNIIGSLANQFQQGYAPILYGQQQADELIGRDNPLPKALSDMDARTKAAQQAALNRKVDPNLAALLGHDRYTNPDPSRLLWNQAAELSKNMFPMPDPDSAYMDSAQYLADKNAALNTTAPVDNVDQTWFESLQDWAADAVNTITGNETTTEEPAPTTPTTPEGFEQYDKGYVEQQPWYLNGDIGVFGKGVQPTEWTDPETGQTYRVEISPRGRGWYPVGWGDLPDMGTDTDTGGNDWWNYTGWGGGGGGGYYSSPISYGNSNWIDRVLTNWRIRTR